MYVHKLNKTECQLLLQTEIDGSCQIKVSVPVNTELILLYLSDKSLDMISYLYIK